MIELGVCIKWITGVLRHSGSVGSFLQINRSATLYVKKKSLAESWNLFRTSLGSVFSNYYYVRKIMVSRSFSNLSHWAHQNLGKLKGVPWPRVILAVIPYAAYLILFSSNQAVRHVTHLDMVSPPNFMVLSKIERTLFFCFPHRVLSTLANPIFDVIAAVPYLVHFPLPFLFAFYLAVMERKRDAFLPYVWCLGWVNFVAVLIQIGFPTAPPWFVDSAVLDGHHEIIYEAPSEGGFSRIDKMFGIQLFHGIYSTSPLKFGAFPSLHVAVPMVVFLNHPWLGKKFGAFHVILITLSAVYIRHHFLIDAIAGILLACVVRWCILKVWSPFLELKKTASQTDVKDENV